MFWLASVADDTSAMQKGEPLPRARKVPTAYPAAAVTTPITIAPARLGRALAAAIPGAVYREWERASHALPIQLAAEVNGALGTNFASS